MATSNVDAASGIATDDRRLSLREALALADADTITANAVQSNLLSLSIVIEWENTRLSEAQRSLRMLNELARQLDMEVQETSREIEILVLHNPGVVEREAIEALICEVEAT